MPLLRDIQLKEEFRGELLREIFSIQEEERRRIARELHDETSQDLASLNANLEAALGMLPDDADRVRTRLKAAQTISISILDEIHKLIYELRPSLLDDLGLGPAVRWLAEVNLGTAGIKVDFKSIGKERRLPPQLETTLFRITKESFSNITRHARARNVSLNLYFNKTTVKVHIQDDGTGFDVEEAINSKDRPRGLGLLGMKERVELMNGTLNIQSRPDGDGTVIDIEIPLKQEVTGGENKNTGGR
jgi:signal transduction histidine kinase